MGSAAPAIAFHMLVRACRNDAQVRGERLDRMAGRMKKHRSEAGELPSL